MDKLPLEFIKQPPHRISDLTIGESANASAGLLSVDPDGTCYILPTGKIARYENEKLLARMVVRREADGYHIPRPRGQ